MPEYLKKGMTVCLGKRVHYDSEACVKQLAMLFRDLKRKNTQALREISLPKGQFKAYITGISTLFLMLTVFVRYAPLQIN
jgi:hypothetical protein